eukprot:TRINITY_DN2569_c2_g1_i1.p1 TRINITY_DN2569_c2_g1~~TRINITY_DN2569_c2_g1_i1.p1  ORF type:complete len:115 (-),score=23.13 TRINITY_DN2569_c2_g1_i1:306-650(-)
MELKLTSFDNRPSIYDLQQTEQQLVSILDLASQTCNEIAQDEADGEKIQRLTRDYLNQIKTIRDSLETQVQRMIGEIPYQNSAYGSKKEAEIAFMKVQIIHRHLKQLTKITAAS